MEGPAALAEALEELLRLASEQPPSRSACSCATSISVAPASVSATLVPRTSAGGAAAAPALQTNVRGQLKQAETHVSAQGKALVKAVALPAEAVGKRCREDGSNAPANLGPESESLQARRTQAEQVDSQQAQQLQQQLQQQDAGEQQQVQTLVA
jgi:hypothetical protein